MRPTTLGVVAALALSLTACGSSGHAEAEADTPKEPIPISQIDQAAWTRDLVATGGVRAHPDLSGLYNIAKGDCTARDDSGLELRLTLIGAQPDVDRINMKYVCPSKAHLVDDALRSVQDSMSDFDDACALPANMRTQEQEDMVEAVEDNPGDCD